MRTHLVAEGGVQEDIADVFLPDYGLNVATEVHPEDRAIFLIRIDCKGSGVFDEIESGAKNRPL